ncbi:hypothetical protein HMPREF1624_04199 [Sporothrix schenckii ATCC 58251]|uniref:AB hydrolase-1 domain-containing protein n=1 Tax=Sporothrix schenckii (strain ATCC 58251 / de Perez 2211183) TaxID=1391915 RepID=U7PW92_SPOS1|nr:hypothetical protein HMPREF1624_04199 [Sporothrix schenckii ATCC 58251]
MAEQLFTLPDGRTIAYRVSGAPDGYPLVWFHGTPSSTEPPPALEAAAKKQGIRIIAAARPGYGGSGRHPGRRVVDAVADTQALNDFLGVRECLLMGWSGGGPHALACAARLPGARAALTIAGVGPADAPDLDFLAGQGDDNVEEFRAAAAGEPALRAFCDAMRSEIRAGGPAGVVAAFDTILSDVDKAATQDPANGLRDYLFHVLDDGLHAGVDGWIDDDLEFTRPWGFDLAEIDVPVLLYQGSDDKMVPYAHGQWFAKHLPAASLRAHLIEGEGHVSLVAKGAELLTELVAAGDVKVKQ